MDQTEFLSRSWPELDFVAFDTEASGPYPLSRTADLCEFAAVRWRAGQVVSRWSTLLKPRLPMSAENVAIHGITNAMVEGAPRISEMAAQIRTTFDGAIGIAHHAPFDLGFLALEFERAGLPLPQEPVVCSSLLSRRAFPEIANHRLQTLIAHFGFPHGAIHRATDDAEACLAVAMKCFDRSGSRASMAEVFAVQGGPIFWGRFSMNELRADPVRSVLVDACERQLTIEAVYGGGSTPGQPRRLHPEGVVRSLDGDFLVAYSPEAQKPKRYLLDRITSAKLV